MTEMNEGLFDDFTTDDMPTAVEDETVDSLDTPVESTETTIEEVPAQEDTQSVEENVEPFLQIKYDKQDIGLTREEAKELAEKGKNYERLFDKYSNLNGSIEKLARLNGMDVNTFISELGNSTRNIEINKELEALRNSFPNTDEQVLNELATKRVEERLNLQEQKIAQEEIDNANRQDFEIKRQLDLFRKEFPNLEPDKLDTQVYDYVRQGYSLLEAYNKWAREQEVINKSVEDSKSKVSKLNEDNKKKSLGNTNNVGEVEKDSFLSTFLD